jgi:predicted transcriptional regulator
MANHEKSVPPVHKPESSLRLSVSLSSELHASLERIAKRKKVSLAWVVREAAEKYVADETPLFRS